MLAWFHALMPKDDRFFALFERHGETVSRGAAILRRVLDGGDTTVENCAALAAAESEADRITQDVLVAIRRTFMTPFDRSDIRDLITSMDDAIDQMNKTAKTIVRYDQTVFEPCMLEIGEVIERAAKLTARTLPLLRSLRANATEIGRLTEEIRMLEEQSDQLYDKGMSALYRKAGQNDAMTFIIGSLIYEHLEKVVDRLEDVANEISGLLIEQL